MMEQGTQMAAKQCHPSRHAPRHPSAQLHDGARRAATAATAAGVAGREGEGPAVVDLAGIVITSVHLRQPRHLRQL